MPRPSLHNASSGSVQSSIPCRYWTGTPGSCSRGDSCRWFHDPCLGDPGERPETTEQSRFHVRCRLWTGAAGSCHWGAACRFAHMQELPTTFGQDDGFVGQSQSNQSTSSTAPGVSASSEAVGVAGESGRGSSGDAACMWSCVPVPLTCMNSVTLSIDRIQHECGGKIYCDWINGHALIVGTPSVLEATAAAIWKVSEDFQRRKSATCCVCLETPWQKDLVRGRPAYGLLEGCDHTVCLSCIMAWRQNRDSSKEARLGCPVCRTRTYIIVPWPEAVQGDEKMAILEQHKEKLKATPCKFSSNGQPCPAGAYCLYDHSTAPQIPKPPIPRQVLDLPLDEDAEELFDLLAPFGLELEISSDDDVETDDEVAAALRAVFPHARIERNGRALRIQR